VAVARYVVRNAADLERLSPLEREDWEQASAALARARRDGIHLRAAARLEGTTVAKVRLYFGPAVTRHGERGRFRVTEYDRGYREPIHLATDSGDMLAEVRDSRSRSRASEHALALGDYLSGIDPHGMGLRRFRGRRINGMRLLDDRDLDLIDALHRRGDFDWPDFYERV
jgi:hypothetical protein